MVRLQDGGRACLSGLVSKCLVTAWSNAGVLVARPAEVLFTYVIISGLHLLRSTNREAEGRPILTNLYSEFLMHDTIHS